MSSNDSQEKLEQIKKLDEIIFDLIEKSEDRPECSTGLLYIFEQRKKLYFEIGNSEEGNKLSSEELDFLFLSAKVHFESKEYSDAVKNLTECIKHNPENPEFYRWRVDSFKRLEKFEEALLDIDKLLEIEPEQSSEHFYMRAAINSNFGKYKEALNDINKSIKIIDDFNKSFKIKEINCNECLSVRAQIYFDIREYTKAISDSLEAIMNESENHYFYDILVSSFDNLEMYKTAISFVDKLIEIEPENKAEHLFRRGRLYTYDAQDKKGDQDFKKAIKEAFKIIKSGKDSKILYEIIGKSFYFLGKYKKAAKTFIKGLEFDPDNLACLNFLSLAYLHQKKFDSAIEILTKEIELEDDDNACYNNRGKCYNEQKKFMSAISDLLKAEAIEPEEKKTHLNLGDAYKGIGDVENAKESYNKVLEIMSEKHKTKRNQSDYYIAIYAEKGLEKLGIETHIYENEALERNILNEKEIRKAVKQNVKDY